MYIITPRSTKGAEHLALSLERWGMYYSMVELRAPKLLLCGLQPIFHLQIILCPTMLSRVHNPGLQIRDKDGPSVSFPRKDRPCERSKRERETEREGFTSEDLIWVTLDQESDCELREGMKMVYPSSIRMASTL